MINKAQLEKKYIMFNPPRAKMDMEIDEEWVLLPVSKLPHLSKSSVERVSDKTRSTGDGVRETLLELIKYLRDNPIGFSETSEFVMFRFEHREETPNEHRE